MEDRINNSSLSLAPAMLVLAWFFIVMFLWFLAFFHIPGVTPEWLRRTQAVCFGTDESGLPNAGGWILLVLAPLFLLSGILISQGQEIVHGFRYLGINSRFRYICGTIVVLFLFESVWVAMRVRDGFAISNADYSSTDLGGLPLNYPKQDWIAPAFELTDQFGNKVGIPWAEGKVKLLTFVFAHCQTVCPVIMENVKGVLRDFDLSKIEVLMVTLDPWRDTVGSLPSLATHWELPANAHIMSGEPTLVQAVLDNYKIPRQRDDKSGDVVHPALVYLIGKEDKVTYAFSNPSKQWLGDGIRRMLGDSR